MQILQNGTKNIQRDAPVQRLGSLIAAVQDVKWLQQLLVRSQHMFQTHILNMERRVGLSIAETTSRLLHFKKVQ